VTLHPNARRVQDALLAAGSSAEVRELPDSAHTSQQAASALGVEAAEIAKSLVFVADGEVVLVVLRGCDRVDTGRLAEHLGAVLVERADAGTVRGSTGFPIGGVSPVGHGGGLRVVVDRALGLHRQVWAAAGTPNAVFPTSFEELIAVSEGEAADIRHLSPPDVHQPGGPDARQL
jgi:prolyl-tRNA editing enzyme YbaK/EbsC (Cys-tRNA(Pro) deacylase)